MGRNHDAIPVLSQTMKLDENGRKRLDAMKKALAAGLPLAGLLATADLAAGCGRGKPFSLQGTVPRPSRERPSIKSEGPVENVVMGDFLPSQSAADELLLKMEEFLFPSIEMRNASFADVARFLSESFAANDPEKRSALPVRVLPEDAAATLPSITLKLKYVSFPDLVACIARAAGLRAAIDEGALLFVAPGCKTLPPSAVFLDWDSP